jgi:hypothetical protein
MASIEQILSMLNTRVKGVPACPFWPPDVFAVCGAILQSSGGYIHVFERDADDDREYAAAASVGRTWRARIDKLETVSPKTLVRTTPREVRESWRKICAARRFEMVDLRDDPESTRTLVRELTRLVIVADSACSGIGVVVGSKKRRFLAVADKLLTENTQNTYTWDISDRTVSVLAKQHTPQRGATFRSLTHSLSLYWGNDIEGRWIGPLEVIKGRLDAKSTSLLLLPWPTQIDTKDFVLAPSRKRSSGHPDNRYFSYEPAGNGATDFGDRLRRALEQSRQHARSIEAVVFPELALSWDQFKTAEEICADFQVILVCGIRIPASGGRRGVNMCGMQPAGVLTDVKKLKPQERLDFLASTRLLQAKHHRWCLDKNQIVQYELAGQIPVDQSPRGLAWENIAIFDRTMHFMSLSRWMTWCVLVCEDLARQDPVAELVRSVGPNLLITLLMDGPQHRGRWSSRYASVLAEDPGTSVLTLTSLGMAERCRPILQSTGKRADKSQAIALWRDVETGEHEIVLDHGDNACVLHLSCATRSEISADGRDDGNEAHFPTFAGYKSFKVMD